MARVLILCFLGLALALAGPSRNGTDPLEKKPANDSLVLRNQGNITEEVNLLQSAKMDLEAEMVYVRKMYNEATEKFNEWMNRPSNQTVAVPAVVGCISAVTTLLAIFLFSACISRCRSFCSCRRRKVGSTADARRKLMSEMDDDMDATLPFNAAR